MTKEREVGQIQLNLPNPLLHYHQSQFSVPVTGNVECVTTSVVVSMNMIKDIIARDLNTSPLPDIRVEDFANKLNGESWKYRFPSYLKPVIVGGWMHPVLQAPNTLKRYADVLRQHYGRSFFVRQTSGNTLKNIINNLQDGYPTMVHGMWGFARPHTMNVVGYNADDDKWIFLNTGETELYLMSTESFKDFWSRKSPLNGYTKSFTLTTLIPDSRGRL